MSEFKLYETLPTLYGKDIAGNTKQWSAAIFVNGLVARYTVEYGQVDGKLQTTSRDYKEGKNIGKANETTPLQQCLNEIKKKWFDKKSKECYTETLDVEKGAQPKTFPMLAHVYDPKSKIKTKNPIVYPCFVQPKLDGLRCLIYLSTDGTIITQSRTGGTFTTMEHITGGLIPFFKRWPTVILDGELYTNKYPFEELVGLIKRKYVEKEDLPKMHQVHFHIYDIVSPNGYLERRKFILDNQHLFPPTFEIVKTEEATTVEDFKAKFTEYVQEGYEGIMLRNKKGAYESKHSHNLQKYKEFEEDEFVIVGFREAEGRDSGTVIWRCATKSGNEFDCRPIGSIEHRKSLFQNARANVGKMLTIKYQELSEKGIPRFLSGKSIRDGF
jgi:DNA ligase 1